MIMILVPILWFLHVCLITSGHPNCCRKVSVLIHTLLTFLFPVIMVLINVVITAHGIYAAGNYLHWKLLDRVLKAKMTFFDSKPLGMILNRFSKDIDVIGNVFHHAAITETLYRLSVKVVKSTVDGCVFMHSACKIIDRKSVV